MKILSAIGLMLAGAACLAAACGGDDSAKPAEPTPDAAAIKTMAAALPIDPTRENGRAKAMLLTVADFPTGWANTPDDPNAKSPFDKRCPTPNYAGKTGEARSGTFSRSAGADSISESIKVFDSAENVSAALDKLQATTTCYVDAMKKGDIDTADAKVIDASVGQLSFPPTGDKTVAFRIIATFRGKTAVGATIDEKTYIDIVAFASGTVGTSIQFSSSRIAPDPAMLTDITRKGLAKIK